MTTIKDIVEFIQKNKRGKAFVGIDSLEDILHCVCQAIEANCFAYTLDAASGQLVGVVTGSVIPEQKVFYVTNILATQRGTLNTLLGKFTQLWPSFNLEARRHGKIKRYNTQRFLLKVNSLTLKQII